VPPSGDSPISGRFRKSRVGEEYPIVYVSVCGRDDPVTSLTTKRLTLVESESYDWCMRGEVVNGQKDVPISCIKHKTSSQEMENVLAETDWDLKYCETPD
jgi:hypothetical protein